ncbi:MAG: tetratricopeptide repeat protein [bacterium]|nr:tetratricopeptide repeat protein [bacterium]
MLTKERISKTLLVVAASLLFAVGLSAQDLKQPIQAAFDAADTVRALQLLDNDIATDPTYHYNYHVKGMVFYRRDQYAEAAEQFSLTLEKKKKYYESLYYLGRCQLALGDLDGAEESMKEGLKKARKIKDWFENGTGLVLMAREQYSEADVSFRRAISIDSTVAEYHLNLGDANFFNGVAALARMEYEIAQRLDTAGTEVYFHWAEACLELKDYTCAIEKLRVVLTMDSTYAEAWNRAGGIYFKAARSSRNRGERKARFMDAIGSYKKYIELTGSQPDSSNVRVYFESAMAYNEIFGFEDAVVFFDHVLSIPYEPRDIYYYCGRSLWGIKDYERAAEMLLRHIDWVAEQGEDYSSNIDDRELYQLLGDSYFYRKPKDFSTSVRYYKKSLADRPDQKRLLQNVALAYHNLRSYAQALEYYDLRIAEGIDSNSVSMYKNAGSCALALAGSAADEEDDIMDEEMEEEIVPAGEPVDYYQLAIDYLTNYLEYNPNDSAIVLRVANTYLYHKQDCANGVTYFERLLTLNPDDCSANKSLGFAYFGEGICTRNYTKALGYFRKAYDCLVASEGACADFALVKWIAQAYHLRATEKTDNASADYRLANEWYSKALKCDPTDTECKKGYDDTVYEF